MKEREREVRGPRRAAVRVGARHRADAVGGRGRPKDPARASARARWRRTVSEVVAAGAAEAEGGTLRVAGLGGDDGAVDRPRGGGGGGLLVHGLAHVRAEAARGRHGAVERAGGGWADGVGGCAAEAARAWDASERVETARGVARDVAATTSTEMALEHRAVATSSARTGRHSPLRSPPRAQRMALARAWGATRSACVRFMHWAGTKAPWDSAALLYGDGVFGLVATVRRRPRSVRAVHPLLAKECARSEG